MKKFILYIVIVLGITQLNLSCTPESKIPFLGRMHIVADSLLDAPFPDSLNFENRGLELTKEQYYALCSDSTEGEKIVSIRKYKDNYLLFFCRKYYGWVDAVLLDKYGKQLDRSGFLGLASRSCRVAENGKQARFENRDSIDMNTSLWNIRCQDDDKFVLEGVLGHIDTLKMTYSISDKITKISRMASKEIATPSLDIMTLALSQPEKACELASSYMYLCRKGDYGSCLNSSRYAYRELYRFVRYNPQVVLQWIYDHRENKKVEKTLFICYEVYSCNNGGISKEFLRDNILKLKDKKAQEYLLNIEVFKDEFSME